MAASTISRDVWANDSGTAATPNGDGTVINNSVLQNHIYARIDAMFAGAGAYTTFQFGGLIGAEGFGTHALTAGGTGGNSLRIRNTSAGSGNFANLELGNDATVSAAVLYAFSSSWSTSGRLVQDSCLLDAGRVGGLGLSAAHASGEIRFYTGGGTQKAVITSGGKMLIGDTSDADVTVGLTINQGANDDGILAFKSSDISHGLGPEADTFALFSKVDASLGGLHIAGYSEATSIAALRLFAITPSGSGDTTKSTSANGYVDIRAFENSTTVGADENLLVLRSGNTTRFIFDGDGDSHQDVGSTWTNYDQHEDVALLHALSAGVSKPDDPLRATFGHFLEQHRDTLEQHGIVTFNEDGHHFINWSRTHMLMIGAIRQLGMALAETQAEVKALRA